MTMKTSIDFTYDAMIALLDGRKTQTRRIVKDVDKCLYKVGDVLGVQIDYYAYGMISYATQPINDFVIKITAVRMERFHDITNEDCIKQGVSSRGDYFAIWRRGYFDSLCDVNYNTNRDINEDNPYVWVVDFEVIKKDKQ